MRSLPVILPVAEIMVMIIVRNVPLNLVITNVGRDVCMLNAMIVIVMMMIVARVLDWIKENHMYVPSLRLGLTISSFITMRIPLVLRRIIFKFHLLSLNMISGTIRTIIISISMSRVIMGSISINPLIINTENSLLDYLLPIPLQVSTPKPV